jgi:hypothetical protein
LTEDVSEGKRGGKPCVMLQHDKKCHESVNLNRSVMKEMLPVDAVMYMYLLQTLNVWQVKAALSSTLAQAVTLSTCSLFECTEIN